MGKYNHQQFDMRNPGNPEARGLKCHPCSWTSQKGEHPAWDHRSPTGQRTQAPQILLDSKGTRLNSDDVTEKSVASDNQHSLIFKILDSKLQSFINSPVESSFETQQPKSTSLRPAECLF